MRALMFICLVFDTADFSFPCSTRNQFILSPFPSHRISFNFKAVGNSKYTCHPNAIYAYCSI